MEKTHDPEGQANESKQNWVKQNQKQNKIQAHAHRDKLPKCLQSPGVCQLKMSMEGDLGTQDPELWPGSCHSASEAKWGSR